MSKDPLRPLVEVLAAFAAARNYSYVDRVGNSLELLTALEAIKDALRDLDSTCNRDRYIERDEASNLCVPCPQVSSEDLRNAVNFIQAMAAKGRREFLEVTRKLATNALSRTGDYRKKCGEGG
ncbi:MAG: hypothetical protein F7B17_04805 [Desulfurococcales archaeon]|nr:hypothetical protein [Desulfurococcales archaeon]